MKRPSFQFYPADWRNNSNLRRCSDAARGVWMDILCLLHDSDEYGLVRWPLKELARAAGVKYKLVCELRDKQVLKGADENYEGFIYRPRHAGKDGEPIVLIAKTQKSVWFSSRFVKDEWIRKRRGSETYFKPDKASSDPSPNPPPMGGIGGDFGDGPSSSSSSSSSYIYKKELTLVNSKKEKNSDSLLENSKVLKPLSPQSPSSPAEEMRRFLSDEALRFLVIEDYVQKTELPQEKVSEQVQKFIQYWTEKTKSGKQERWELEKTFELNRRLGTWFENYFRYLNPQKSSKPKIGTPEYYQ